MFVCATLLSLAVLGRAALPTEVHVHPGTGSDATGDGSAARPLMSVHAARDQLRTIRAARGLPDGARVVLHAGTHAPFALDAKLDSGALGARIVYEGMDGAVVSGGIEVPAQHFSPGTLSVERRAVSVER